MPWHPNKLVIRLSNCPEAIQPIDGVILDFEQETNGRPNYYKAVSLPGPDIIIGLNPENFGTEDYFMRLQVKINSSPAVYYNYILPYPMGTSYLGEYIALEPDIFSEGNPSSPQLATGNVNIEQYTPESPELSVVSGSDSLTVSITGDSDVTHTVWYKLDSGQWAVGGSRTGDGDVVISGLASGTYQLLAYSSYEGRNSLPSNLAEAVVAPLSLSAWVAANRLTLTAAQLAAADLILEFGQAVTYQPAVGSPRNIYAVVRHNGIKRLDAAPQGHGPVMTVSVFNHSAYGITAAEVDTGKDTIVISNRVGSAVKVRRLARIVRQDEGIVQFEAR